MAFEKKTWTDRVSEYPTRRNLIKEDGTTEEHEIANISGLSHEWKRKLAAIDVETGEISLNPEYEG